MALINITGEVTFTGSNTFPGNNTFNFQVPAEFSERLSTLETTVQQLTESVMTNKADFLAAIQRVDAETTRIATKVQELTAKLADRSLTQAEADEVMAAINAETDKLKPIGADPENVVPA